MDLKQVVEDYLQAIQNRHLDAVKALLAENESVALILPNGQFLQGKSLISELYEGWFSDPDWSLSTTHCSHFETSAVGVVIIKIDYLDKNEEGQAYELSYFRSLTFIKEDGRWRLTLHQDTATADA